MCIRDRRQTYRLEQLDTQTVQDVEALEFEWLACDHPDVYATVGEYTVDVEANQLDPLGHCGRDRRFRHGPPRGHAARSRVPGSPVPGAGPAAPYSARHS